MCGIAGIIRFSQRNMPADSDLVWKMLDTLKHRGPDHAQVKSLPTMTLGHTRLSIVDPSESSNQPLVSGDGRYWITFNGEIYNFLELRSELETAGREFQTQSDTEVILAAYQQWGAESLHRLNGMWAFAIHDLQTGENFLARDRFGVKPLYYSQDGNRLLFASEMKALLAAGVAASPNFDVLRSQHSLASCDCSDRTIFSQIRALPAGHSLRIRKDKLQVTRWWNTLEQRIEVPRSRKERIRKFYDLLEDATRLRLRSDVGTAVTLSGGMDSSAVYLFTKQITNSDGLFDVTTHRKKQPKIFSVTHPGEPTDESKYARMCLDQFGDEAHWLTVSPDRFREQISEIIRSQESPVWSVAVFAFHEIYRKIAKANIRVVLEGHGSDEMLGGYPYLVNAALKTYAKQHRLGQAWQAARCLSHTSNPHLEENGSPPLRAFLANVRPWKPLKPFYKPLLSARSYFKSPGRNPSGYQNPSAEAGSFLTPEFTADDQQPTPMEQEAAGLSEFKRELYVAFHERILPTILRVFDRATMASSVESRMPFLDYRLVQFVFSLPETDIIGGGETKHILRRAVAPYLPKQVVSRRNKMGFGIAATSFFQSPQVQNSLQEIFFSNEFRRQVGIRTQDFLRYFRECLQNGFRWRDTARVWEVLNLHLWWKTFIEPVT